MKGFWRSAWVVLVRKRLRTAMTVCAIAIGTAMVVLVSGVGAIGEQAIDQELESMGMNGLSVSASEGLTTPCLTSIRQLPMVTEAMPLLLEFASVELNGRMFSAVSCGVDAGADQVISLKLLYGRLLTSSDLAAETEVCVVDANLAREAYGTENIVGRTLTLWYDEAVQDVTVVGVTATGSSLLQNVTAIIPYMVYVPYTTMQTVTGLDTFDQIAVRVSGDADEAATIRAIERSLQPMKDTIGTLKTENLATQRDRLENLVRIVSLGLTAIGGVSLLVSGCGIMTAMLSAVHERTREIGIKKAIGATRGRILAEFMISALLISGIGALCGIILGMTAVMVGAEAVGFSAVWQPMTLLLIFAITLLLGGLFGAYPAYKAAGLKPVDALRQEN